MQVDIQTSTMGFSVDVDSRGVIKGSHLSILDYSKRFEHRTYDRQAGSWLLVREYFYFDREKQRCFFPRYDLEEFIAFLKLHLVSHRINHRPGEEGKHVNFYMLPHINYKNDKQKNCVEFLTNPASGPIRGVALQTGTGKTVAFIMALQQMHRRSMITMTSRLEQWVKEIQAYTTLEEDDLYVISGVGSLTKLFSQIDKGINPKIILASAKTIRLYLDYGPSYQHLPHPSEACEKLGIGIIGTDEYHEHFYTNYLIGLLLNPALFIPITATFVATDPFVKDIFDRFIPKDIQFVGGAYDKFVTVTAYSYRGGQQLKPFHYTRRGMYSQVKFEETLLSPKFAHVFRSLLEDAILPIIRTHYINIAEEGEKFLFLCATKEMCKELEGIFRRQFNSKSVSVFYSGMSSTILQKYDMIISTPGSAGTGRDIKGLRTCFAFENTSSEIRNLQFLGRLRGPPQMLNEPEFVYLSFATIPQHVKYHNTRSLLFGPRAKIFRHRTIS